MTVLEYCYTLLTFFHSAGQSRIDQVLRETDPIRTLFGAIIERFKDNPMARDAFIGAGGDGFRLTMESFYRTADPALTEASLARTNEQMKDDVLDIIAEGLLHLRALTHMTSWRNLLNIDANALVTAPTTGYRSPSKTYFDYQHYLTTMNLTFNAYMTVWGNKNTVTLAETGKLTQFVPAIVQQLPEELQYRALDYMNDLVRKITSGKITLPPDLAMAVSRALEPYTRVNITSPNWYALQRFVPRPETYNSVIEQVTTHTKVCKLAGPTDLAWFADTKLIIVYWSSFIHNLLPSSARVRDARPTFSCIADDVDDDDY